MKVYSHKVDIIIFLLVLGFVFAAGVSACIIFTVQGVVGFIAAAVFAALYLLPVLYICFYRNFFNKLTLSEDGVCSVRRTLTWQQCSVAAIIKIDRLTGVRLKCVLYFFDPKDGFDERKCVKSGLFVNAYDEKELTRILQYCHCVIELPDNIQVHNAYYDIIQAHNLSQK